MHLINKLFFQFFLIQLIFFFQILLFGAAGSGAYNGFGVFYSWFSIPFFITLDKYFFIAPLGFLIASILLFLGVIKKKIIKRTLNFIIIIHIIGAVIANIIYENQGFFISEWLKIFSTITAIILLYYFWRIPLNILK